MSEEMKNLNEQSEETVVETPDTQVENVEPTVEFVKPQFIEKKPLDKKTLGIIAGAAAAVVVILGIILGVVLGGGTPHVHNFVNGVCECGEADPNYVPPVVEHNYTFSMAVDTSIKDGKVTNYVCALVVEDGKIVAVRFDSVEITPTLDDGAVVATTGIKSKVELGTAYDAHYPMGAGTWSVQAKAFEDYIIGKTADEVANLDLTLVTGCTMSSSRAVFQALVAEAFASANKINFKTTEEITLTVGFDSYVESSTKGGVTKATAMSEVAALVFAGDKVAAAAIDSIDQSFTLTEGALVAGEAKLSKAEQGADYSMRGSTAGTWVEQSIVFAKAYIGLTAAEVVEFVPVSDALAAAGCTLKWGADYHAAVVKALDFVR